MSPNHNTFTKVFALFCLLGIAVLHTPVIQAETAPHRPNIILIMTDDQGWGQMGYYNHPVLKTPNLDAMAANGLRFDRFYAGASNCSPTRATVLTGRSNDRTGVENHGFPLRLEEKTLPQALKKTGYATGHFGKWHLNGFSGPGVPILKDDPRSPGVFGFDTWVSVTNYFEVNPLMSRKGEFEGFKGDSSDVIVDEALKFIAEQAQKDQPSFSVIWYGTPHKPFIALEEDKAAFKDLDEDSRNHYAELAAMDRSIGILRKGLRDLGIAENTLLWFNSDNGGLPKLNPESMGGLRGNKSMIFEGGIRVPGIVEWPAMIQQNRITQYPASTMDIFPTIVELLDLPQSAMLTPVDGASILPLFKKDLEARAKPIPFRRYEQAAWIENNFKLLTLNREKDVFNLYDLANDPKESRDLKNEQPERLSRMIKAYKAWSEGVDKSYAGEDYPDGFDPATNPRHGRWTEADQYKPYLEEFQAWQKQNQQN